MGRVLYVTVSHIACNEGLGRCLMGESHPSGVYEEPELLPELSEYISKSSESAVESIFGRFG